jgi:hypothetical protein
VIRVLGRSASSFADRHARRLLGDCGALDQVLLDGSFVAGLGVVVLEPLGEFVGVVEDLLDRSRHGHGSRNLVEAVTAARSKGLSWQRIGELLGTSAQAAQQRYGHLVETA